jgi:hypothetical protein
LEEAMQIRAKTLLARLTLPALALLLFVVPLFGSFSCTTDKLGSWEAASLDEAKTLAAQHQAVILVDFWKHN